MLPREQAKVNPYICKKIMRQDYRIGLDVGTNSLGWSVLLLDESGIPNNIEAAGARIFTDGRDEKTKATLAATRRTVSSNGKYSC